jgi:uncharacterized protein YbaP (TraB family)
MRKWLALACTLLVTGAVAQPAPQPPALDPVVPQWAEIETVHATAAPGPALWHVTKGDSEVWILGMVGGLPKGVTWNQQPLAAVMTGSHALILGPRADINLLDISWFLISHCCSPLRLDSGKLDDFLPDPTKLKLAAMRESVGGDAKLYQGDEPLRAAMRLSSDFGKKYDDLGGGGEDPMQAVLKLARDNKVPQQPIFHFDPIPLGKELLALTPQQQRPCLEAQMEDIERRIHNVRPMAEAWAVGDISGIKEHFAESRITDCLAAAVHAFGAMQQNQVPGLVAAIDQALDKPGKTFVVIGMGPLLRKNGVLEQLEGQHLAIEGPAE